MAWARDQRVLASVTGVPLTCAAVSAGLETCGSDVPQMKQPLTNSIQTVGLAAPCSEQNYSPSKEEGQILLPVRAETQCSPSSPEQEPQPQPHT